MHTCDWYDLESKGPCLATSNRAFNLERHVQNVHEKKEAEQCDKLGDDLSSLQASDERVRHSNQNVLVIRNPQPKSTFHTLLLPTSTRNQLLPFDAFQDPEFLAIVRKEAQEWKWMVATELRRIGEVEWEREELPKGRDWEKEVIVGVHANSLIGRLHVHILSVDMHSQHILHKKHYNSFQTPFFIDLADFPLTKEEVRSREKHLRSDLKCWRCGENFGDEIARLKDHLAEEFIRWRAE